MSLRFHNQLTKTIDDFTPQHEGKVSLYTCGPTVYNSLTVGNWTAYVYWDTLVRTLQANGLNVTRVMNITDVGHLTSDDDAGEDFYEKTTIAFFPYDCDKCVRAKAGLCNKCVYHRESTGDLSDDERKWIKENDTWKG